MNILANTREMLEQVRTLPAGAPQPTVLEVLACERREASATNLLAFFLDPNEPHGLRLTCLRALFVCLGLEPAPAVAAIETEVRTPNKKRIDLLIETDRFVIGIENKLFHRQNNPFGEYRKFVRREAAEREKKPVLALLALQPEISPPAGFKVVTHRRFADELRKALQAADPKPGRYRSLLDEFIRSIENLDGGPVDKAWQQLFGERRQELDALLQQTVLFREELSERAKELSKKIDLKGRKNVSQFDWSEDHDLHRVVAYDIKHRSGLLVTVDAVASPAGWTVEFVVMNDFSDRQAVEASKPKLEKLLKTSDISFGDSKSMTDPKGAVIRCVSTKTFSLSKADLNRLAAHLDEVIAKLAG